MERRSGVEAALASAEAEFAKAEGALAEAQARVCEHGAGLDEATTAVLTATIASARQSDDAARLREADRMHRERADEFADRLRELFPWTGGRNDLFAVMVPAPDQLQRWASAETQNSREIDARQVELDRIDTEAKRLEAKIGALGAATAVVSDRETAEAWSAREAAWAEHKKALDARTAAEFETAMRKLDLITEQRSRHASAIADLNRALLDLCRCPHALGSRPSGTWKKVPRRRATLIMDVENALRAIGNGLDHTVGLSGLNLWLQKLDRAIGAERKTRGGRTRMAASAGRSRLFPPAPCRDAPQCGGGASAERRPGGDAVRGTSRSGSRGGRQEPTSDPRGSKAGPELPRDAAQVREARGLDHGARLGRGLRGVLAGRARQSTHDGRRAGNVGGPFRIGIGAGKESGTCRSHREDAARPNPVRGGGGSARCKDRPSPRSLGRIGALRRNRETPSPPQRRRWTVGKNSRSGSAQSRTRRVRSQMTW